MTVTNKLCYNIQINLTQISKKKKKKKISYTKPKS
jgi:hypothetical protein